MQHRLNNSFAYLLTYLLADRGVYRLLRTSAPGPFPAPPLLFSLLSPLFSLSPLLTPDIGTL